MAWECMAVNGTGSMVFINDVTADRHRRFNYEIYSIELYFLLRFGQLC